VQALSYLITYRESGSSERRENLFAVLRWLGQWPETEVVVIEQDSVPRLERELLQANGGTRLAYNPGAFNKAWGLNVAARMARGPLLALADGDVIVPRALPEAAERCAPGQAVKPYRSIVDLTAEQTARVRGGDWSFAPKREPGALKNREGQGEQVVFAGGLFLIRRDDYLQLGGFDERFVGWGGEDDAMTVKLQRAGVALSEIGDAPALHLWHPRSHESTLGQPHYAANRALLADYATYGDAELTRLCEVQRQTMGNRHKYRPAA
jgi:GT2 family glycosyltransferase